MLMEADVMGVRIELGYLNVWLETMTRGARSTGMALDGIAYLLELTEVAH